MNGARDPLAFRAGIAGGVLLAVWAALMLIFAPPAWASWSTGLAGAALTAVWAARERAGLRRLLLSPHLRSGSNAIAFTVAVAAAVALVNVITTRHAYRADLTANKFYSLSDQTLKVLKGLPREVKITAFVKMASPEAQQVADLLKEYKARGGRLAVELVDVDQKPAKAMLYKINAYNTVVLECGSRRKDIASHELFGYQFSGQQPQREFKGEPVITAALLSVAADHQPVVYFLEGHGELATADTSETGASELKAGLERDNNVVKTLNLLKGDGKVPADADLLVLAGPRRGLPEGERKALAAWLAGTGRMVVLVAETTAPGLDALLGAYGVTSVPGLAADPRACYSFGGPLVPIPSYEAHKITEDLQKQGVGIMMPFARGLTIGTVPGGAAAGLLETTPESWAETTPGEGANAPKYTAGKDTKGPLTLGVAVTINAAPAPSGTAEAAPPAEPAAPTPKLVVFGGAAWARNDIRGSSEANSDLFANAVSWLTGSSASISIRAKPKDDRRILLDEVKVRLMWWVTVVLTPLAVLAFGGVRWYRRRSL